MYYYICVFSGIFEHDDILTYCRLNLLRKVDVVLSQKSCMKVSHTIYLEDINKFKALTYELIY